MRIDRYANRTVYMDMSHFNRDINDGAAHIYWHPTYTSTSKYFDSVYANVDTHDVQGSDFELARSVYDAYNARDYATLVSHSYHVRHITNRWIDMYQINIRLADGIVTLCIDTGKGSPVTYKKPNKHMRDVKRYSRTHRKSAVIRSQM
jgi:hypothetical protein